MKSVQRLKTDYWNTILAHLRSVYIGYARPVQAHIYPINSLND